MYAYYFYFDRIFPLVLLLNLRTSYIQQKYRFLQIDHDAYSKQNETPQYSGSMNFYKLNVHTTDVY